jgi:hypothetical protein
VTTYSEQSIEHLTDELSELQVLRVAWFFLILVGSLRPASSFASEYPVRMPYTPFDLLVLRGGPDALPPCQINQ